MALLGLLELLAHGERLQLCVGHVDHGLRPASAEEAAMVRDVARARGFPVRITTLDLRPGAGLPARARDARRAALLDQAADLGARVIALGHTATDQAETMLLHLVRGAGLDGLAAMPAWELGPPALPPGRAKIRPVLGLTRDETRALVERLELPFVDDPTNLDPTAPRIAMRERVLPILRALNPAAEQALSATASRAREAEEALQAWVQHELRCRRIADTERWSFDGVPELPTAVRRGLVRAVCQRAGVPADALGRRVMEAIDAAVCHPGAPHGWDLHGGRRLRLHDGIVWLELSGRSEGA